MALERGGGARIEPDEPGAPVRDLAPRRRLLYWSMLVPLAIIAIVAAVMGSALVTAAIAAIVVIGALVAQSVLGRPGSAGPQTVRVAEERRPSPPSSEAGRLGAFFDRLDRLPTDAVRLLAVRPLDPVAHEASRERATVAARFGGRTVLVGDATARIADWIGRAFGTRSFDPEMVAIAWRHEPLRLEDREWLRETLADVALAVAVEDLIDDATYAELVGPCGRLVGDAPEGR